MKKEDILFEVGNGIGWIKLNRPKKLNSISDEMVEGLYKQLLEWKEDNNIAIIILEGEGKKAFSAGGDVRTLYDLKGNNLQEYVMNSFSREYSMDMTIHLYPKPILVYMNGYVMGGGAGIAVGGSHRIVTDNTKWAMPETKIGLFPDVGASYFLNKMPGHIGLYLALTAKSINAADALYTGIGDYYIDSSSWDSLRQDISKESWVIDLAEEKLDKLINKYKKIPPMRSSIAELQQKIDRHFGFDTVEEIVSSLQDAADQGDEWADNIVKIISSKSPTSLKVTLRQLIEGKKKSMKECFKMELEMSINFMECYDFFEGVRAVLVDKDKNPKWKPSTLEEVKEEDVVRFLTYPWNDEKNPLDDFKI